ncbi:MAG: citryl-CoA synthetase large subunit [Clostridia bacterium]|nr:citryl-CoA synthetase large subunit [Clostridia bacterium]
MGRMLENHTKTLLYENGLAVPQFKVAASVDEVRQAADELGGKVVLKALVPVGKKGKAGAVKFADGAEEAGEAAAGLLGTTVRFFPVEKILVEQKLEIEQELFVSITLDKMRRCPVVLASTAGGMDVEEIAAQYPEKMRVIPLDPFEGLPEYKCREIWTELGLSGGLLREAASYLYRLYQVFARYEATVLEINPLAVTPEGKVVAAGALMAVDDAAVFRHPELKDYVQLGSERAWRPLTELEKEVVAVNEADPYRGTARYTEMEDGDIGFMCGGGGGSLMVFDTLLSYGGRPANYTEFGGNPPERKVFGLVKTILSKPGVKGLLVDANITNNTQVDLVAQGIVRALKEKGIDPRKFPVVVRLAGVNDAEGRRILAEAGVEYYGEEMSMSQAARRMVEKMREAYGG